jgi:rSAM/selenodomain-associated transferase 2
LNEASHISGLIKQLRSQEQVLIEVIVVDGGSNDDTVVFAKNEGARIIETAAGRGHQMNQGAAIASHERLLFLHADTQLTTPRQFADAIETFERYKSPVAGHFALTFDTDDEQVQKRLRFFEHKTRYNRPGTFNGDQGLLINARDFEAIHGFSETYPFLEDPEFADRFLKYGEFITLPHLVRTSARRFEEEGIGQRLTLNTIIMGMYHIEAASFFERAPDIYRQHAAEPGHYPIGPTRPINLRPFLALAQICVFQDGFPQGLKRCYRIGRYATRNFWQIILLAGLRYKEPDVTLRAFDRYIKPVTDNPPGHLLGTFVIIVWFFWLKFRASRD